MRSESVINYLPGAQTDESGTNLPLIGPVSMPQAGRTTKCRTCHTKSKPLVRFGELASHFPGILTHRSFAAPDPGTDEQHACKQHAVGFRFRNGGDYQRACFGVVVQMANRAGAHFVFKRVARECA